MQYFTNNEGNSLTKWAQALSLPSDEITTSYTLPSSLQTSSAAGGSELSGGAIAGIVLGSLAAVGILTALLVIGVLAFHAYRAHMRDVFAINQWFGETQEERHAAEIEMEPQGVVSQGVAVAT